MSDLHSALLAAGDKQVLVAALADIAGMPIPPANLPAVTTHLVIAATMARLLFAAEPPAGSAALAPVYRLPGTECGDLSSR